MIKLQIVGNLGKDCILKEVNGKNVINFSVAHTEKFKDSTGSSKRTNYLGRIVLTGQTERLLRLILKKGRWYYAEGSPEAEAYTNKENMPAATLRMRVRDISAFRRTNRRR